MNIPSIYQKDIHREFRFTENNIVVKATAGSGKTTTLLDLLTMLPRGKKCIFVAFNKSIVNELNRKVPQHLKLSKVRISTMHGLGMRAIMKNYGEVKLNEWKTFRFVQRNFREWGIEKDKQNFYYTVIQNLVDLYRMGMCSSFEELDAFATKVGTLADALQIRRAVDVAIKLDSANRRGITEVDYTDMIYIPATWKNIRVENPDITFIDEAQDLNKCQQALIFKVIGDNRFVVTGDPNQAIYGFCGSDKESFERFLNKPNTVELPLSISYRCGGAIVDEANSIIEDSVELWEGAPRAKVWNGKISEAKAGDYIICRNKRPLVIAYFQLLQRNIKSFILGEDFGKDLLNLVNRKASDVDDLLYQLEAELGEKSVMLKNRGIKKPISHPGFRALMENINIIHFLGRRIREMKELRETVEHLFENRDPESSVMLSTMHKSKGLESERVFILERELIPSPYAETSDQLLQEKNLMFVAVTRAKKSLIYI